MKGMIGYNFQDNKVFQDQEAFQIWKVCVDIMDQGNHGEHISSDITF